MSDAHSRTVAYPVKATVISKPGPINHLMPGSDGATRAFGEALSAILEAYHSTVGTRQQANRQTVLSEALDDLATASATLPTSLVTVAPGAHLVLTIGGTVDPEKAPAVGLFSLDHVGGDRVEVPSFAVAELRSAGLVL